MIINILKYLTALAVGLVVTCMSFIERPAWTCERWKNKTCACARLDGRGAPVGAVVVPCRDVPEKAVER